MKLKRVVFYSLVCVLALVSAVHADPQLLQTIHNKGLEHYFAADYVAATDYFEQVLQMAPLHAQARFYLVNCYAMASKNSKAIEHAQVLVRQFPGVYEYVLLLQQLQQQQSSYLPVTRPVDQTLIESGPDSYKTMKPSFDNPAKRPAKKNPVFHKAGKLEEAISMIDEEKYASASALINSLIAAEPKNSDAVHYLGVIHFNQAEHQKAAELLEKAVTLGSKRFETRFLAASSYLNLQNLARAEEHFKKALELKEDVFCKINLAEIYCRNYRLDEAEKIFKAIGKSNPEIVDAKVGLAQIQLERGDSELAIASINEILGAHPENARARFVKARLLMESKLYADAAEEARLAFENSPVTTEFRACYALALIRNFDFNKGLSEIEAILQQFPDSIDALLARAEGLIISGNSTEAEKLLEDAAKTSSHPEISLLQASIATAANKADLARKHYEEFRKRAGIRPRYLLEYARFIEVSGSVAEARKAYGEIIKNHPDTAFARTAAAAIAALKPDDSPGSTFKPGGIPIPGLSSP